MVNEKTIKEPLFHIVKRDNIKTKYKVLIYAVSIVLALFFGGVICSISAKGDPFSFFASLFQGAFGSQRKIWILLQRTALLVGVSMALLPAFKMKFWNLGANGQILIGALAAIICMKYLGKDLNGAISDPVLIIIMIFASVIASTIWAVIPAILKVFFNTNEALLTLMMNYIAQWLVTFFLALWLSNGKTTMDPITYGNIPQIANEYLLIILVGIMITAFMTIYLKFSKHGYELSIVGDSQNTANYIGLNVKKVVIRTMILCGAVCGIAGFLLVSGSSHTVSETVVGGRGFTAVMISWLGHFNPLEMVLYSVLNAIITVGSSNAAANLQYSGEVANVLSGLFFLLILTSEFFTNFRIRFNIRQFFKSKNEPPMSEGQTPKVEGGKQ